MYVDELIVRRELAINFATHHPGTYDRFEGLPRWARETLAERSGDERAPRTYTRAEFERARTHDARGTRAARAVGEREAAQLRADVLGQENFGMERGPAGARAGRRRADLNNKYSLDGRDPASYTGVGWCFGLHDRPFPEAPVTGTIRRMSERGMRAKFDEGVGRTSGGGANPPGRRETASGRAAGNPPRGPRRPNRNRDRNGWRRCSRRDRGARAARDATESARTRDVKYDFPYELILADESPRTSDSLVSRATRSRLIAARTRWFSARPSPPAVRTGPRASSTCSSSPRWPCGTPRSPSPSRAGPRACA